MDGEVVSKGAFAEMMGVSAPRVSQWLREGKIGRDALVGEGRAARVNVALARRQLAERLDPSQAWGINGLAARGSAARRTEAAGQERTPPRPATPTPDAEIAAEKLKQARLLTSRMEREDGLAAGRYVLAAEHRRTLGEQLGALMQAVEGALPDLAAELSAELDRPSRDVTHALRKAFRSVRQKACEAARMRAVALPEIVEAGGDGTGDAAAAADALGRDEAVETEPA